MPLITKNEDSPPIKQPAPVRITDPRYKGVTVDTKYQPVNSLLTTLEGSNWVVNYYRQVLDDDNFVSGQMPDTQPVYQQYWLIKEFELKVTNPLTYSQDDETKESELTGSGHVHPVLIPNVGDMFLASIGDGREGIFKVTSSETKSIFKDTAHYIEYKLIDYSTVERREDLNSKTIKVTHYLKDFNYYGQNPIVEDEEYYLIRDLKVRLRSLVQTYFDKFFTNEYQSLMLPGQQYPIYDHFHTSSVKILFNTDENPKVQFLRLMAVSDDQTMKAISLWDAVIHKDKRFLYHVFKTYGLVSTATFTREPMMESIHHSGFEYVIYPKDNEISVDYELQKKKKETTGDPLIPTPFVVDDLLGELESDMTSGLPYGNNPLLYPVTIDDYYILSENFYNKTENQSKFELAVRDHIENKPVNRKLLKVFCETYHLWGSLERFYYTPILIMMIKSVLKGA